MRILIVLFFIPRFLFSQNSAVYDLRQNANYDSIIMNKDNIHVKDYPTDNLNYVKTLLYTWKLMNLDSILFFTGNNGVLLQSLSSVGDIEGVKKFSRKNLATFPQLNDTAYINKFKRRKIYYFSAKKFILQNAIDKQIVMFNEGHDRPQTRAFLVSILSDLKNQGFECLAMETLSEIGNLEELDTTTGFYTQEPMAGEVVREGLRLGFELVPYEQFERPGNANKSNSSKNNKINEREVAQARNLYNRIKTSSGIKKTIVLAGYGHIAITYDSTFTSMAMYFKKYSGITPFCVEQTLLLEDMKSSPYANKLLTILLNKDSVFAFMPKDLLKFGFDSTAYDIFRYNPPTSYLHNRPNWLITSGDKNFVKIEIPKSIKPVFVQAYVCDEIKSDEDYKLKIPIDQTFYSENNKVWLSLRRGKKYNIIYRDEKNKIIFKKVVLG